VESATHLRGAAAQGVRLVAAGVASGRGRAGGGLLEWAGVLDPLERGSAKEGGVSGAKLALLLEAISLVESGGNPRAVGQAGELGRFQLTPAVVASVGGYGEHEAEREVRRIIAALERMGVDPQPFNIYLAYNAGLGAVRRGEVPVVTYQRAVRLCKVIERLERERGLR
jgi:hypothetical protein